MSRLFAASRLCFTHTRKKLYCNHAPSIKNTVYPAHALRSLRCGSSEFFKSSRIVNFSPSSNWPNVTLALPILFPSFGPPATFIGVNKHSRGLAWALTSTASFLSSHLSLWPTAFSVSADLSREPQT